MFSSQSAGASENSILYGFLELIPTQSHQGGMEPKLCHRKECWSLGHPGSTTWLSLQSKQRPHPQMGMTQVLIRIENHTWLILYQHLLKFQVRRKKIPKYSITIIQNKAFDYPTWFCICLQTDEETGCCGSRK
jgi:hypothetical protein